MRSNTLAILGLLLAASIATVAAQDNTTETNAGSPMSPEDPGAAIIDINLVQQIGNAESIGSNDEEWDPDCDSDSEDDDDDCDSDSDDEDCDSDSDSDDEDCDSDDESDSLDDDDDEMDKLAYLSDENGAGKHVCGLSVAAAFAVVLSVTGSFI
ncbi:hypothetical protein LPJ56_000968 [Coemansia sp. RSA 2599]|nr:hypothetical protein LPJ75_000227 [Coemansia sp. RSA 2598]KAJ1828657.1 hypothetical protein LPJ56_000968 [Coemansia sp. RSA 2599]